MKLLTFSCPNSSFIKHLVYDSENERLAVLFNSLSLWIYQKVSLETYESLIAAESIGNFFNLNIRNFYDSNKIANIANFYKIQEGYVVQEEK